MKNLLGLILLLFLIPACNPGDPKSKVYTKLQNITRNDSLLKANNDTVVIDTEHGFKFTQYELQELYKREPAFHESEYPDAPETAYNDRKTADFNSELGKDIYYTLYATS
ncbi:hypothetical protein [Mucilaginibacter endophyticus]|uniref:hypothetical protein n=1 Tax=Mucilaginibacter endophyticus TaxID=2675003 RepID=UPI000E0D3E64|nr:hypothetical protein [Mucilaginibacter endophyticus]